MHAARASASAD
jgi:hypothetical protein